MNRHKYFQNHDDDLQDFAGKLLNILGICVGVCLFFVFMIYPICF